MKEEAGICGEAPDCCSHTGLPLLTGQQHSVNNQLMGNFTPSVGEEESTSFKGLEGWGISGIITVVQVGRITRSAQLGFVCPDCQDQVCVHVWG